MTDDGPTINVIVLSEDDAVWSEKQYYDNGIRCLHMIGVPDDDLAWAQEWAYEAHIEQKCDEAMKRLEPENETRHALCTLLSCWATFAALGRPAQPCNRERTSTMILALKHVGVSREQMEDRPEVFKPNIPEPKTKDEFASYLIGLSLRAIGAYQPLVPTTNEVGQA